MALEHKERSYRTPSGGKPPGILDVGVIGSGREHCLLVRRLTIAAVFADEAPLDPHVLTSPLAPLLSLSGCS